MCSRPAASWLSTSVIQASFLAGFALEERPSWCLSPGKVLLDPGLCFWDYLLLLWPPSEDGFSAFSFVLLASEGTAGGLQPLLSAAVSHCRPVVAMGEAGGAEALVMLPLSLTAAGLGVIKMGSFSSFFPNICKVGASSSHILLFFTFLLAVSHPRGGCSWWNLPVADSSISWSHHLSAIM